MECSRAAAETLTQQDFTAVTERGFIFSMMK